MDDSWTIKKAEHQRTDTFKLWSWQRLLRVPWTARRSNQSILKEINSEYSLEGLMLSWSSNTLATWCKDPTHWKRPWCLERLRAWGEGDQLNGHEFEQTLGNSEGRGRLVCYSPWCHELLDTTEQLNNHHHPPFRIGPLTFEFIEVQFLNKKMYKWMVLYSYKGIQHSKLRRRKNECWCTKWLMNPTQITLSKKSQAQNNIYYMIPSTWNSKIGKTNWWYGL